MEKLSGHHLRALGKTDKANRWFPIEDIAKYFSGLRPPSRVWPNSYAKSAQTLKFAKWLRETRPETAAKIGL